MLELLGRPRREHEPPEVMGLTLRPRLAHGCVCGTTAARAWPEVRVHVSLAPEEASRLASRVGALEADVGGLRCSYPGPRRCFHWSYSHGRM